MYLLSILNSQQLFSNIYVQIDIFTVNVNFFYIRFLNTSISVSIVFTFYFKILHSILNLKYLNLEGNLLNFKLKLFIFLINLNTTVTLLLLV